MTVHSALSRRNAFAAASLAKYSPALQEIGRGRWSFAISNGSLLPVSAEAREGWLTLEAPIPSASCEDADIQLSWTWLELNARLQGPGKIARPPASNAVCLRAEIPLDEDVDVGARVRESCLTFASAAHSIGSPHASERECLASEADSPGATRSRAERVLNKGELDLAALCRDANWAFTERDAGWLAVDLGVAGDGAPAVLERRPNGDVRASVEVVRRDHITPASREALGAFLLTSCAAIRLARAAAQDIAETAVARFEVRYGAAPCPIELGHALSALSVASAMFGREARALLDDRIAHAFLAMRDDEGSA